MPMYQFQNDKTIRKLTYHSLKSEFKPNSTL